MGATADDVLRSINAAVDSGAMVIRPAVLRTFYEVTYGKGATNVTHSKDAFRDATFDEYFALMRIFYPQTTRGIVASQAFAYPAFAARVDDFPEAPGEEVEDVYWEPPKPRPRGANAVLLHRRNGVDDLSPLRRVKPLRKLFVQRCKGVVVATRERIAVEKLEIDYCPPSFAASLFAATRARVLWWIADAGPVDLAWIAHHAQLRELLARGASVVNVACLAKLRALRKLELMQVDIEPTLSRSLAALAKLEELVLDAATAVAPTHIPFAKLPALRRVAIPAHAPLRAEWIDFAMRHPAIGFSFDAPPTTGAAVVRPPEMELVEEHRGVEILSCGTGAERRFRIESDVAEAVGYPGSNGDLEDDLAALAKQQRRTIAWGSEAGTLVATGASVALCRWIIDAARAVAKARPKKRAR